MWALLFIIGFPVGLLLAVGITMLLLLMFRRPSSEVAATVEYVPAEVVLFSLSRYDVMDHVESMQKDSVRFVVPPVFKEREEEENPDYLLCGERCFAIVFERSDVVHNIAVRLSDEVATLLGEHHTIERASYMSDNEKDWYNLTIDQSFKNKKEVYGILNSAYDYVLTKYGQLDEEEAKAELVNIDKEFASGSAAAELEKAASAAELNYLRALEKFKADYYSDFAITRKEIIEDTRSLGNPDIGIFERAEPQMPASLKHKGKTYAILYGTDRGVMMVVKLSDAYADKLSVKHPQIRRAKFPAGANWYYVPVDGAFESKDAVYAVLNVSYGFVLVKYGSESEVENAEKLIYSNLEESTQDDAEYLKKLEEFRANYSLDITRHQIMEYSGKLDNPNVKVIDRPMEPQLPTSLKFKTRTYAMLYGTESGVIMIMKLDDSYAKDLMKNHQGITKAKFPAGPNWYYVPVDNKFENIQAVYPILTHSLDFVEKYTEAKAKARNEKAKEARAKAKTEKEVAATKEPKPKTTTKPKPIVVTNTNKSKTTATTKPKTAQKPKQETKE
ncbi:MAG: hypothetical protein FWC80_07620 [Firmicutes bacterium]|nr:hypothetical protein [Bacillota bacterium]